jgi:hypothetical protein
MKTNTLKTLIFSALLLFSYIATAQQGDVTVIQDKSIDRLLEFKKDLRTIDIYKIQIYSGDRLNAEKTKSKFLSSYKDWKTIMEFNTPNYKIWVGNFRDRLEADRALAEIKKKYTGAFIFHPKEKNK